MCCDSPSLKNQRISADSEGSGAADGSCVDEMGYLLNAEWGGRYHSDEGTHAILSSPGIQSIYLTLADERFTRPYCATTCVGITTLSEYDGALLKATLLHKV